MFNCSTIRFYNLWKKNYLDELLKSRLTRKFLKRVPVLPSRISAGEETDLFAKC
jgi:hypothetical protein